MADQPDSKNPKKARGFDANGQGGVELLVHSASVAKWYMQQMWRQFFEHDCMAAASALTYTTLFAVVPMMTVTYLIFSLIPEYNDLGEQVQQFIFNNFVPGSSEIVQEKLSEFAQRARDLTAVGLFILFGTSFMLLMTIEKSFNTIWHVPEPRRGMQRFLLYWGVLSLGPISIIAGIVSSVYLMGLDLVPDLDRFGLGQTLLGYFPILVSVGGFSLIYYAVPNCRVQLKHAVVGGVVTTMVFQLALNLFGQMSKGFSYNAIYGTFAALPVFLLWLYFVWVIVLCGAIFVRSLALMRQDDEAREPMIIKATRILRLLHDAHMDGTSITDRDIQEQVVLDQEEHDKIFRVLQDMKVLGLTDNERWTLSRNLKMITLWDLYCQLPEGLDLESLRKINDLPQVVEPLKSITQFGSNEMAVSLDVVFTS
ncbi:MAG: YihY family inner membrane protein [Pseudomonadota bacterium]